MYSMDEQLAIGEEGEKFLDIYFAMSYNIRESTELEQREGIDRVFTKDNIEHTVEYKTDYTAGKTGNAFIEMVSVDTRNIKGWALTSRADWLFYYVPYRHVIYIIAFPILRKWLGEWKSKYKISPKVPNERYNSEGLLVPLMEMERISESVIKLDRRMG